MAKAIPHPVEPDYDPLYRSRQLGADRYRIRAMPPELPGQPTVYAIDDLMDPPGSIGKAYSRHLPDVVRWCDELERADRLRRVEQAETIEELGRILDYLGDDDGHDWTPCGNGGHVPAAHAAVDDDDLDDLDDDDDDDEDLDDDDDEDLDDDDDFNSGLGPAAIVPNVTPICWESDYTNPDLPYLDRDQDGGSIDPPPMVLSGLISGLITVAIVWALAAVLGVIAARVLRAMVER